MYDKKQLLPRTIAMRFSAGNTISGPLSISIHYSRRRYDWNGSYDNLSDFLYHTSTTFKCVAHLFSHSRNDRTLLLLERVTLKAEWYLPVAANSGGMTVLWRESSVMLSMNMNVRFQCSAGWNLSARIGPKRCDTQRIINWREFIWILRLPLKPILILRTSTGNWRWETGRILFCSRKSRWQEANGFAASILLS